jgi:hypothetical protein
MREEPASEIGLPMFGSEFEPFTGRIGAGVVVWTEVETDVDTDVEIEVEIEVETDVTVDTVPVIVLVTVPVTSTVFV